MENITSPLVETKIIIEDYPDYIDEDEKSKNVTKKIDNVNDKLLFVKLCDFYKLNRER